MTTHSAMNNRPATGHTIRRRTVKSIVPGKETSICSVPRVRQTIIMFDLRCLSKVCFTCMSTLLSNMSKKYIYCIHVYEEL